MLSTAHLPAEFILKASSEYFNIHFILILMFALLPCEMLASKRRKQH